MVVKLYVALALLAMCFYETSCSSVGDSWRKTQQKLEKAVKFMNCTEATYYNFSKFVDSNESMYFFKHGDFDSEESLTNSKCFFKCLFDLFKIGIDKGYKILKEPEWEEGVEKLKAMHKVFKGFLTDAILSRCKPQTDNTDECDPAFNLVSCAIKKYNDPNGNTVSTATKDHFSGLLLGLFISSYYNILNQILL